MWCPGPSLEVLGQKVGEARPPGIFMFPGLALPWWAVGEGLKQVLITAASAFCSCCYSALEGENLAEGCGWSWAEGRQGWVSPW